MRIFTVAYLYYWVSNYERECEKKGKKPHCVGVRVVSGGYEEGVPSEGMSSLFAGGLHK